MGEFSVQLLLMQRVVEVRPRGWSALEYLPQKRGEFRGGLEVGEVGGGEGDAAGARDGGGGGLSPRGGGGEIVVTRHDGAAAVDPGQEGAQIHAADHLSRVGVGGRAALPEHAVAQVFRLGMPFAESSRQPAVDDLVRDDGNRFTAQQGDAVAQQRGVGQPGGGVGGEQVAQRAVRAARISGRVISCSLMMG